MARLSGISVDRYTLEEKLGEGGMAVVYRARHTELGSLHAIKQLKVNDPLIRDRLLREGRLQSGLNHPNVVNVTDMITIEDSPALVMEYVDGPDLSDLLASHRPKVDQCDEIALGILRGVAAAHRHGLVHRDLKPANILIDTVDGKIIPKITDFGLAKALEQHGDNDGLTKEGMVMGTPSYMAPEQLSDTRSVDGRADVFSLGAILYELVCGQRCFTGATAIETWLAISKGNFVAPVTLYPEIPERMARAIEGALIVDRQNRISQVSELIDIWSSGSNLESQTVEERPDWTKPSTLSPIQADGGETAKVESDLAFDYTQDSFDVPSMSPSEEVNDEHVTASRGLKRSRTLGYWSLLGLVLSAIVFAAVYFTTQPAVDTLSPTNLKDKRGGPPALNQELTDIRANLLATKYPAAQHALDRVLKADPKHIEAHVLLAITHFFRDRPFLALSTLQRGASLADGINNKAAKIAKASLESIQNARGVDATSRPWRNLRQGYSQDAIIELSYLISTGYRLESVGALKRLASALDRFSSHPIFTALRLKVLRHTGQIAAWHKLAQVARLRFPGRNSFDLQVAQSAMVLGQFEQAEKDLKRVLDSDNLFIEARIALAELYTRQGKKAERQHQFIISQSDAQSMADSLGFLHHYGAALASAGELQEADKVWDYCVRDANSKNRPIEALACAQAALTAYRWLMAEERWDRWIKELETGLAHPSIQSDIRQFYALQLLSSKIVRAIRLGEQKTNIQHMKQIDELKGSARWSKLAARIAVDGHFEYALRTQNRSDIADALGRLERLEAKPIERQSCSNLWYRARAAKMLMQTDKRLINMTSILDKSCRMQSAYRYIRALTQLEYAGLKIGANALSEAAETLTNFHAEWAGADRALDLIKRSQTLSGLLGQK